MDERRNQKYAGYVVIGAVILVALIAFSQCSQRTDGLWDDGRLDAPRSRFE
jgi:hypothetical protein